MKTQERQLGEPRRRVLPEDAHDLLAPRAAAVQRPTQQRTQPRELVSRATRA